MPIPSLVVRRLILSLLLFFLFSARAVSAVFIVTSNADSGPGTLRDALTQAAANGSAEKDYINFNLSDTSKSGRTLLLITQLPNVSSNLVIDGTTQMGSTFGQSNAFVKISTPQSNDPFTIFNGSGLDDVEIYGLYLYDYTGINVLRPDTKQRTGINILQSSNIIIGAPDKGNLIKGFNASSIYLESINIIIIQSNVIGLSDLNDVGDNGDINLSAGINLIKCNNISIGGDPDQGNIIFCGVQIDFAQKTTGNNLVIESNNFGVFPDGKSTTTFFQDVTFVTITTMQIEYQGPADDVSQAATINAYIKNNTAGNFGAVFTFGAIAGNVNFTNNYFGIARDGVTNLNNNNARANEGVSISIPNCPAQFNIGGIDLSTRNFFAYQNIGIAAYYSPNVFIRNNEYQCLAMLAYSTNFNKDNTLPAVSITDANLNTAHSVLKGTSDAGALIDVYSSESCTYAQCGIRKYIETVTADNNGNWKCDIFNLNGIFYVSATLNNRTSPFKTVEVNSTNVAVTNLRCNSSASITGLLVPNGINYYWTDQNGNVVSNTLDLTTNNPGKYQLQLAGGCISSEVFEVVDDRMKIFDYSLVKTDVSCGTNNGAIKGLYAYDPLSKITTYNWNNGNGKAVGNTADVADLPPGSYTLTVGTSDECNAVYGPVIIKNTTGPNIDQTKAIIQSTNCGQSAGSISNLIITGTGILKYSWQNSQQQEVGTDKDLLNQPAGTYKLQVTDDTQCGPIYSTDITIPETNGITMDESNVQAGIASCGLFNGSITGIKVTGASSYVWTDGNGATLITTTPDLLNMLPGDYVLTASNQFGCSKMSQTYHITQQAGTTFPAYTSTIVSSCFASVDGSISVATDALVKSLRWADSAGQTVGSNSTLPAIAAGIYQLYLTDQNGCETLYSSYTVPDIDEYLVQGYGTVTNDQCGLKTGGVSATTITGGIPPYKYTWTDASGNQISTDNAIANLAAGKYTLNVVGTRCGNVYIEYTIGEETEDVPAPSVTNVTLCSAGDATITINNADAALNYRLYDNSSTPHPLSEQKGGNFKVVVTANRSYYISEVNGSCESPRTEVQVSVGLSAKDIANTFTPNSDGINDYWQINALQNYPKATIQVFTRAGQLVFNSIGYGHPFDGNYNGKKLPAGVYYYVVNLGTSCKILSGSLTIIR